MAGKKYAVLSWAATASESVLLSGVYTTYLCQFSHILGSLYEFS